MGEHRNSAGRTALRLAAALSSFEGRVLPPIRDLCARFGVSRPTMTRALALLREAELLVVEPRKRIVVRPALPNIAGSRPKPAQALYEHLKSLIQSGAVAADEVMPKIGYFVAERRVSGHTVIAVYRRLVAEGLLHRRGKRYIAGAAKVQVKPAGESNAILIFSDTLRYWSDLCRAVRTREFGEVFLREARRQGVRVDVAACKALSEQDGLGTTPVGRAAIGARIRDLGPRYLGALIASSIPAAEVAEWSHFFLSFGRPTVVLDRNDQYRFPSPHAHLFTRCHYVESSALAASLQFLRVHGHRRLAYAYVDMYPWEGERLSALRTELSGSGKGLSLCGYRVYRDRDWGLPRAKGLEGLLRSLHAHGPAQVRAALDRLVAARPDILRTLGVTGKGDPSPYAGLAQYALASPDAKARLAPCHRTDARLLYAYIGLWPALRFRATALIAPSDVLAMSYHAKWLKAVGLAVPRDMSLISFDNSYRGQEFPTSVDFGFDYLGYQAYHAIVGDTPVERDRRGNVAARARVVDVGTVASVVGEPGILRCQPAQAAIESLSRQDDGNLTADLYPRRPRRGREG